MKSEEYWKQRAEARMTRGQAAASETLKELQEAYAKAGKEIQGEIRRLYERYGDEHGLTYAEAIKYIDQSDYKEWRMSLADYVKRINATGDEQLQRELDTLSTRSRVTRLETVQTAVKVNAAELAQNGEDAVTQLLSDTYTDTYYRAAYDMQMGVGVGSTLEMLAPGTVAKAISYPWSGADYSKRIWDNADRMTATLQSTITQGLVQGKDVRQMTKAIVDATGASVYNAERLVRTETAYAVESAELKSYADSGVTQYEVLATLDERTCKICGGQDGKVYDTDKAVTSKNYPPFHSSCRCTTTAHFSQEQMDEWERLGAEALGEPIQHDAGERFARDAEGKGTTVQGNLKYEDWFDQYVKADKAYATKVKAYQNHSGDVKQLAAYRDRIGKKDVPASLGKFQALKYGDEKTWKEMQIKYRSAGKKLVQSTEEGDIIVMRSLGAKAPESSVLIPGEGYAELVEGSRIKNVETIAGKGSKTKIRELQDLIDEFGGTPGDWRKKKGIGRIAYNGEEFDVELHWYQEPVIGKVKMKCKVQEDGRWFIK